METFQVKTGAKEELLDITRQVQSAVDEAGGEGNAVIVYVPHTTAGVTINENADPDVVRDILFALDKAVPDHREFRHAEGNSTAHVKSSLVGASAMVLLNQGSLVLGTWQSIFFCEFDGPRTRRVHVRVL